MKTRHRMELLKALDQEIQEHEERTRAMCPIVAGHAQVRLERSRAAHSAAKDRTTFPIIAAVAFQLRRRSHGSDIDPLDLGPAARTSALTEAAHAYAAVTASIHAADVPVPPNVREDELLRENLRLRDAMERAASCRPYVGSKHVGLAGMTHRNEVRFHDGDPFSILREALSESRTGQSRAA